MALYLVVRHQKAPQQTFHNIWMDDELLTSIQTTLEVGELCRQEMNLNHVVYIHRCGYLDYPPVICCSVHITDVEEIGGWIIVKFGNQTPLDFTPPVPPVQGQNNYFAPPP